MLQINSETAHGMFTQIMERFDKIERTLERMNKLKDCLDGDTLLDNYPVPAARHHQAHAGALPAKETRDLLHD